MSTLMSTVMPTLIPTLVSTYRLENLTVRHPGGANTSALRDIDLVIEQGEQVAIIGPSGAGKTTLLATLACAHRPASGRFLAFGADPWALPQGARHRLRAKLFLAPQTPPLPPRQRVVTAVLAARLPQWNLWRALVSLVKPADPEAAFAALERFQLGDKLYARVDRLSGGERQRCALARLLLSQAQALLVDEPLSALDPALSQLTIATLLQEATMRGATLVCSLHQVEVARASFARVIGLRDGRIVFDLPRAAVSDALVAALYQSGAGAQEPGQEPGQQPAQEAVQAQQDSPPRRAVGACF